MCYVCPYTAAGKKRLLVTSSFRRRDPYHVSSILALPADIEAARIADIRDSHQQSPSATPNNASIAIAGDFDLKKLKDLLSKYFGPIPENPAGRAGQ